MTIERPMFPPRAESPDSFSRQAGIGQPEAGNSTGESPRGAGAKIIAFSVAAKARVLASQTDVSDVGRPARRRNDGTMHTFLFRSYSTIIEADEADLIRDVGADLHKAEVKLRKIKERLQGVQEQAAAQVEQLTAADHKLSAAIVAALLSNRREG